MDCAVDEKFHSFGQKLAVGCCWKLRRDRAPQMGLEEEIHKWIAADWPCRKLRRTSCSVLTSPVLQPVE